MTRTSRKSPREKGMATVLVMALVGMAVTATTVGTIYIIRSTQDSHLALHANSGAQSLAWAGVELTREYLTTVDPSLLAAGTVIQLTSGNDYNITATVFRALDSGEIVFNIAGSTRLATTTLQVVYDVESTPMQFSTLDAGFVFNGDLNYTGGGLQVLNGTALTNAIITGDLSISSGASARICACVKGNITASGGGLTVDSSCNRLHSEKKITISNMSQPNDLDLRAKEIEITQSGGRYSLIRAGAFAADVKSNGPTVGRALVGGQRTFDSDTGTYTDVIQPASNGTALIRLTDGPTFTLDLARYAAGPTDGLAVERADSVEGEIPGTETLSFHFNSANTCLDGTGSAGGICGGDINFRSATVGELWGNTVLIGGSGEGGGSYSLLKGHQRITTSGGNISVASLFSGGDLWLKSVTGQYQTWALVRPSAASRIDGQVLMSDGATPWTYTPSPIPNLQERQRNAAPGLPGIPYCSVSPNPVDVEGLQSAANYVFYFEGGTPMLRIQGVRYSSNNAAVPSGPYDLSQNDPGLPSGISLICNWSAQNDHCGKSATPGTGWQFTGIKNFPVGVAWFQGNVTFNGLTNDSGPLITTLLATGDITLTNSGNDRTLTAPNRSTPQAVCDGTVYPASLCDKSVTPSRFITWDDNGTTRTGNPIGNIGIATERSLQAQGWTINGNTILGGAIRTGGSTTTINGGLVVGGNGASTTTSQQGGLVINTSTMTTDQTYTPGGGSVAPSETTVSVKWIREI